MLQKWVILAALLAIAKFASAQVSVSSYCTEPNHNQCDICSGAPIGGNPCQVRLSLRL